MKTFLVTSRHRKVKLLPFLREKCGKVVSVKAIKRAIDAKKCLVNGHIEMISTTLLASGDRVEIDLTPQREILTLPILYEDEDLLVCNKPPFLLCDNRTINAKLPQFGEALKLIHRLDKETSGVLLIAKTEEMRLKMITLFRTKQVKKLYHGIVDGRVEESCGRCESYLVKKRVYDRQTIWVASEKLRKIGLHALTNWKCLKRRKEVSYLECELVTGRTHQIRVHLKEKGHPILGDVLYGGESFKCRYTPFRNLLHAYSLAFIHPFSRQFVSFKALLPKDFKEALAKLFQ